MMKRIYIPLLVAGLILTGVIAALAQSGGGYDLSWSTVGGGTYGWGEGGGYSAGGAIAQAGPEQPAGGGYTVTSGFWHPVCQPQAVAVAVACSGGHVQLTWVPDGSNKAYDIHRSTTPYFEPGSGTQRDTVMAGGWSDPDANTCGDSGANYYYQVRSTCMGAHADGNRCGEFDFGLVPGD